VQMADNILRQIKTKIIYRIDVNFHFAQKDIDSMIGRKAHIKFIDDNAVQRLIVYRYGSLFKTHAKLREKQGQYAEIHPEHTQKQ
jgi:hypothetical protein